MLEIGSMTMDTIGTIRDPSATTGGASSAWRALGGCLARGAKSLASGLDRLLERRRSRLALLEMTDDQLKDIGISRCDAHREGIRHFWDGERATGPVSVR